MISNQPRTSAKVLYFRIARGYYGHFVMLAALDWNGMPNNNIAVGFQSSEEKTHVFQPKPLYGGNPTTQKKLAVN